MPTDFAPGPVPTPSAPLQFPGAALLDAEKLDAYRVALEFQALAGQLVPKRGYAELRDQLERASISVVLNIATDFPFSGPLRPHIDAFVRQLQELGYASSTRREKLGVVADFSRWLQRRELLAADVDEQIVVKYLGRRRRRSDPATLRDLLGMLREAAVIPPAPVRAGDETQRQRIEREFEQYLVEERGLSQATLKNSLPFVRSFLVHRFGASPIIMDDVRAPDVTRFLLRKLRTVGPSRAKLMVGALRSFFRFLRWRGDIAVDLASSVPKVADWRLSNTLFPQARQHHSGAPGHL